MSPKKKQAAQGALPSAAELDRIFHAAKHPDENQTEAQLRARTAFVAALQELVASHRGPAASEGQEGASAAGAAAATPAGAKEGAPTRGTAPAARAPLAARQSGTEVAGSISFLARSSEVVR